MTEVTSHGIVKWTNRDPTSLVQESQTQGDSIDLAFSKRERFDFVWANSAERTGQTGMTQGSRGYQVDTKSEYVYDNSAWRLALPYAEYSSSSVVVNTTVYSAFGNIAINAGLSTSTTFAPSMGDHRITLTDPGVYSISVFSVSDVAMGTGNVSFTMVGNNSDATTNFSSQIARGTFAGDNVAMTSIPFYRTSAANSLVYFYYRQNSGGNRNISSTIRIGRLG